MTMNPSISTKFILIIGAEHCENSLICSLIFKKKLFFFTIFSKIIKLYKKNMSVPLIYSLCNMYL